MFSSEASRWLRRREEPSATSHLSLTAQLLRYSFSSHLSDPPKMFCPLPPKATLPHHLVGLLQSRDSVRPCKVPRKDCDGQSVVRSHWAVSDLKHVNCSLFQYRYWAQVQFSRGLGQQRHRQTSQSKPQREQWVLILGKPRTPLKEAGGSFVRVWCGQQMQPPMQREASHRRPPTAAPQAALTARKTTNPQAALPIPFQLACLGTSRITSKGQSISFPTANPSVEPSELQQHIKLLPVDEVTIFDP